MPHRPDRQGPGTQGQIVSMDLHTKWHYIAYILFWWHLPCGSGAFICHFGGKRLLVRTLMHSRVLFLLRVLRAARRGEEESGHRVLCRPSEGSRMDCYRKSVRNSRVDSEVCRTEQLAMHGHWPLPREQHFESSA